MSKFNVNSEIDQERKFWERKYFWATILSKNGFHPVHIYQDCVYFGVYYLQVNLFANLVLLKTRFHDSRGSTNPRKAPRYPFANSYIIFPEEGDLLLFPSYLVHEVLPQPELPDARISLAFNFKGVYTHTPNFSCECLSDCVMAVMIKHDHEFETVFSVCKVFGKWKIDKRVCLITKHIKSYQIRWILTKQNISSKDSVTGE